MLAAPHKGTSAGMRADTPGGSGGDQAAGRVSPTRTGDVSSGCATGTSRLHGKGTGRGESEDKGFWSLSD